MSGPVKYAYVGGKTCSRPAVRHTPKAAKRASFASVQAAMNAIFDLAVAR